ncbi:VOC family protein [Phenylobacterium kunshanense]|jgi:catechol 2,3-dioxygenase-like lactoylglutathione lyase family enzyme|uniref:VOC family protein n=1 Tax=Phenylobacterium kunshanense TaxID=1445034 RepID=A0A328BPU3_9CAUL|nr:VOC family protein [Phenylobacterium kunshanense]RAK69067.1 VOC family protein [Phenylobacterium kunshanense]
MSQHPTGIHHLAFMADDIKKHIEFFSQVMGCPLVALFDMHGVPGGLHAFLRMNDHSYFSIVQLPAVKDIPIVVGKTHAGSGALPSAPGTLQHLAFGVDSEADLLAMRDRIRSHGINVIGPIDHGMCKSIYFAGPDQMTLEVATSQEPVDPAAWIDPAVLAKAGISKEEAQRYKAPAAYAGPSPVPQPAYDPDKPHMVYPKEVYLNLLQTPDEVLTKAASYTAPPVAEPV